MIKYDSITKFKIIMQWGYENLDILCYIYIYLLSKWKLVSCRKVNAQFTLKFTYIYNTVNLEN